MYSPTDAQAVLAILNDTQNKTKMPPPKILSDGAVFENIQVCKTLKKLKLTNAIIIT